MRRVLDWRLLLSAAVLIAIGFLVYLGVDARENENALIAKLQTKDDRIAVLLRDNEELRRQGEAQNDLLYRLAVEIVGLRSELKNNGIQPQTPSSNGGTSTTTTTPTSPSSNGHQPSFVCDKLGIGC